MLARLTLSRHRAGHARRPRVELLSAVATLAALILLAVALFGQRLAPHEPIYFVVAHGDDPRPYDPGLVYPLGSDVLGRDLLSLVLAGAGTTISLVILAGLARVCAGVMLAAAARRVPAIRFGIDALADTVAAIPATIVALLIVKILVRADTSVALFVVALLVIGWAGPYRVVRAELDRVAHAPFTEGAAAIGASRWRLLMRHQLPHLVPVIAINFSQQVVASLVLVAELGVLGTFVGTSRTINIEESLPRVVTGVVNSAQVSDPPEWGGLLAGARTIESLWTTRWLVLLPLAAMAALGLAIALIGVAIAGRYSRRDITDDVRRGGVMLAVVAALAIVVPGLIPERYAEAQAWAASARAAVAPTDDVAHTFAEAGLVPVGGGSSFAIDQRVDAITQSGPARVRVGGVELQERYPEPLTDVSDRERNVSAFVNASTGGGSVDAPLVFAGRGISFDDYPEPPRPVGVASDTPFEQLIRTDGYDDDYAKIDVRGKVVLLVRFVGIRTADNPSLGPAGYQSIDNAIKRGAAAVIFVDPALWLYIDVQGCCTYGLGDLRGGMNPYLTRPFDAPTRTDGVPVVVLSDQAGVRLVEQFGIDIRPYFRNDDRGDPRYRHSLSRDLGIVAHVEVPLHHASTASRSYAAQPRNASPDEGAVLVWNIRRESSPGDATLRGLASTLAPSRVPFVLVDFDTAVDRRANALAVREALGERRIALVVVLDRLTGPTLRTITPHGELIPAFALYGEKAGAPIQRVTKTGTIADLADLAPFADVKTIIVTGSSGVGQRDADAASLLGYLAGRYALGAEEVPR